MTLEEKKAEAEAYIKDRADAIEKCVLDSDDYHTSIATCDARGWDQKQHTLFPKIATELRNRGYVVTSKVNHGVVDWTISVI